MNITVRYFASIREAAGTASELLNTEAGTIAAGRSPRRWPLAVRCAWHSTRCLRTSTPG